MRKSYFLVLGLSAISCSSMTSYNEQILPAYEAYREGDLAAAADISASIYDEHYDSNSRVIFALENATMLRDAGYYQQAFDTLEQAEATLKIGYDQRSEMNAAALAEGTASVLINQKALAYTGTIYDRVLLNTYKALAALELEKLDNALVEARRIDQAQQRAEKLFREEYDAIKTEAEAKGYELDVEGMYKDTNFIKQNKSLFLETGVDDFKNPFATFVIGMLRRIAPNNGEDPAYDFKWLNERLPNNIYVKQELTAITNRENVDGTVFVIFENGRGPYLAEELVRIPTRMFKFYSGNEFRWYDEDYLALPKFIPGRRAANALRVMDGRGNHSTTMLVADMNQIAQHEFNERYPGILMREVFSAAIKGIGFNLLQGAASSMTKSDETEGVLAGVLLSLGGMILKEQMAQADDRAWKSIACNYQIARFKRSGNKTVQLALVGGNAQTSVELPDAAAVVIIVRAVNSSHINARAYGFGDTTMN
ncbi:MAG: hypothetical protein H8E25_10935 [Planctomycetes bacterium]|nr:hypothetical protein [Planctomycetota bacterium]